MEYERIHKVQSGLISPSKLRMKLTGSTNQKKEDGLNCNSSRTSPSRQLEDSEFVNTSLLASQNEDFGDEDAKQGNGNLLHSKEPVPIENVDTGRYKMQQLVLKPDGSNSSSVHPVRTHDDESDYDSTSSFEFHKGERSLHHSLTRSLSRPMSSKWNDAEKWIINRQNGQSNVSKKTKFHNQNRQLAINMVRVAPESTNYENKPSVKRVDFCQPVSETGSVKFGHTSCGAVSVSSQVNGVNGLVDFCDESKDLNEIVDTDFSCTKSVTEENAGVPAIRSVSMRDMGTEMTPIPSQEPSRSVTPLSSTTPLRSPNSSIPSTPRRADPTPTPTEYSINNTVQNLSENGKMELSEEEMKLKTRNEIIALGVQLGKLNIAAWASKNEKERSVSENGSVDRDELERVEREERAAAWEEAEKSKHAARFKRKEIRIQAWESRQKAQLESEMKKIEAQIEQMKAKAQENIVKKIAWARRKSEEKRAAAEARRLSQAEKTAGQAEYIRITGRVPFSCFMCCGW